MLINAQLAEDTFSRQRAEVKPLNPELVETYSHPWGDKDGPNIDVTIGGESYLIVKAESKDFLKAAGIEI